MKTWHVTVRSSGAEVFRTEAEDATTAIEQVMHGGGSGNTVLDRKIENAEVVSVELAAEEAEV